MATTNPLHQNSSHVFLVSVLRFADKTIVATYSTSREVTKEGVRECVAGNANITSGKRYTSQGERQSIHYTLDPQGRVYAIVTTPKYPIRVAFAALDELQQRFGRELGPRVPTAIEESLNKFARPILQGIAERYADPASQDKLVAVTEKIDVVKSVMKDNIEKILENEEKLEKIEATTVVLNEKAAEFSKGSKQLRDQMFWKMWKTRIILAILIIAALVIIIVPTVEANKQNN